MALLHLKLLLLLDRNYLSSGGLSPLPQTEALRHTDVLICSQEHAVAFVFL